MRIFTVKTAKYTLASLMLLAIGSNRCSPKARSGDKDQFGCQEPPPDVFTTTGVDLKFAQTQFSKIVSGEINIKTNPQVISLASKAATDQRIRDYLRCLAIHRDKYTPAQAAYLERLSFFMSSQPTPTPEQLIQRQETNPFPSAQDSSGAVYQYMINSPNSLQIKTDNLTVIQDQPTDQPPYYLNVHKLGQGPSVAIEIRPGHGSWAPFFCGIPTNEVETTRVLGLPVAIIRGSKNRVPSSRLISNVSSGPSDDRAWTIALSDIEATPTQGYYAFFTSMPSKIRFGALDDPSQQYVVALK